MPPSLSDAAALPPGVPDLRRGSQPGFVRVAGAGLLVAVGYMDPGNWATDIEAGSRFGYDLLFVVAACSLAAILLQTLAMRLGLVTGRDLAQLARDHYSRPTTIALWLLAELAIVACDLAEVLGGGLAFHLLLGVPVWVGVLLTGLDTLLVLGLQGRGLRGLEAIVLALVLVIAGCFAVELMIAQPSAGGLLHGLVPDLRRLGQPHALYLAVGILGATVMPHNLYLHSAVIRERRGSEGDAARARTLRFATIDLVGALLLATFVNAAILILAAATFHAGGHRQVAEIGEAYRLLEPLTGTATAAVLFAVALLASGQSATFTGTIAGQVILEGFLDLTIPAWLRRLITRSLALLPALGGVLWLGDQAVGRLLVLTQVVLSIQLPFALWPLIRFTSDRALMGRFASGPAVRWGAWALFGLIAAANGALVWNLFGG